MAAGPVIIIIIGSCCNSCGCPFSNWMSSSQFQCHRDVINDTKVRIGQNVADGLAAAGRRGLGVGSVNMVSEWTTYEGLKTSCRRWHNDMTDIAEEG
jgi:hypothetical protein